MRYIALLRGVNVGGKNSINMRALCKSLEKLGFANVSSYINSGNLLFNAASESTLALAERCEERIMEDFGLAIRVAVLSLNELREALTAAPEQWGQTPYCKHNAIFVIEPARSDELIAEAGAAKPEYESLAVHGRVIFWSAALATFSHTRWSKIVGTKAYEHITIRNANTARRLLALAEAGAEPD